MAKELFHLHSGDQVSKVKAYDVTIKVMESKLKVMAAKVELKKPILKPLLKPTLNTDYNGKKKQAYIDNTKLQQSLNLWTGYVEIYEEYIMTLYSMKRDAKTLEEIEEWFTAETGIKNPEMAADALMLKREYKKVLRLYDEAMVIDPEKHIQSEKGEMVLNSEFYMYLKEQATTFYPENATKYVEQVETALKILNSVPPFIQKVPIQ